MKPSELAVLKQIYVHAQLDSECSRHLKLTLCTYALRSMCTSVHAVCEAWCRYAFLVLSLTLTIVLLPRFGGEVCSSEHWYVILPRMKLAELSRCLVDWSVMTIAKLCYNALGDGAAVKFQLK